MFTFAYVSAYGQLKRYTIYGLHSLAEARMAWADHARRYLPGARLVSIV